MPSRSQHRRSPRRGTYCRCRGRGVGSAVAAQRGREAGRACRPRARCGAPRARRRSATHRRASRGCAAAGSSCRCAASGHGRRRRATARRRDRPASAGACGRRPRRRAVEAGVAVEPRDGGGRDRARGEPAVGDQRAQDQRHRRGRVLAPDLEQELALLGRQLAGAAAVGARSGRSASSPSRGRRTASARTSRRR